MRRAVCALALGLSLMAFMLPLGPLAKILPVVILKVIEEAERIIT